MIKIMDRVFYNVKELADMLNLDPQTIRIYFRNGTLKGRKVGTQWHASAETVKAYLGAEEPPQTPAGGRE